MATRLPFPGLWEAARRAEGLRGVTWRLQASRPRPAFQLAPAATGEARLSANHTASRLGVRAPRSKRRRARGGGSGRLRDGGGAARRSG